MSTKTQKTGWFVKGPQYKTAGMLVYCFVIASSLLRLSFDNIEQALHFLNVAISSFLLLGPLGLVPATGLLWPQALFRFALTIG